MIFAPNWKTRGEPATDAMFTLPVLLVVPVICPKVPEEIDEVGLARLV
jgi:hypothetical protein